MPTPTTISEDPPCCAIVFAPGSAEMKSRRPKCLHELCGRSLIHHIVACAIRAGATEVVVVAAEGAPEVSAHLAGASPTARKALGYEELLVGDVEGMKRRTRNYARRQLTWMRKLAGMAVIDTTGLTPPRVAERIMELWVAGEGMERTDA